MCIRDRFLGEVAEWSIAAVLKTVVLRGDVYKRQLYKDMTHQIYPDGSFTQTGFKGEYYNTRNLTGELFQAAIEPAIDLSLIHIFRAQRRG